MNPLIPQEGIWVTFSRLVFVATAFVLGMMPALHAEQCSNLSLKGSFGYSVTGTITANSGPLVAGPFVAVSKIAFDGKGGVQTVRSLNDGGFPLQHDGGTGTYSMNKDCTGTSNITVGPRGNTIVLTLDIVLDDTNELRGVVVTPNVALSLGGRSSIGCSPDTASSGKSEAIASPNVLEHVA